jgi:hypothetical protein
VQFVHLTLWPASTILELTSDNQLRKATVIYIVHIYIYIYVQTGQRPSRVSNRDFSTLIPLTHVLKVQSLYRRSIVIYLSFWHNSSPPQWARASSFTRFLDHTQRRTTVGRTPLDEWSTRRRDMYLTTHNTHNIQTSMPPVEFEPTISADKRPQTYALDRAASGTGENSLARCK